MSLLPIAHADSGAIFPSATVATLIHNINRVILNPAIILMFAIALVYFLYGVFEFLSHADKVDEREKGKRHMIWGIVGMVIMISVFAIMKIIETTLGVDHNAEIPIY